MFVFHQQFALNNVSFETTGRILTKVQKHPGTDAYMIFCSDHDHKFNFSPPTGLICKTFKNLLKNHWVDFNQIWPEATWH
jgi:hypothetical protein